MNVETTIENKVGGRRRIGSRSGLVVAAVTATIAAMIGGGLGASAQYLPVTFGAPVLLTTFGQCGGYEPTVVVDSHNNVMVTAHKQNHCIAAGFDPGATTQFRAQSWLWSSSDGVHFIDTPGFTAVGADRLDVGDEGDLAVDDANHIYFVDTKVGDVSLTSWNAPANNSVTETFQTPAIGTAQPSDDRPWITAHRNGIVAYFGNEGDKTTYSGQNGVGCSPPLTANVPTGRFTVYMSTDGGQNFNHLGCTLPDSGWCRPAADHSPASTYFYAFCTNDSGVLYSFVSPDNGFTWNRYVVPGGYVGGDQGWPSETVDTLGNVYALYGDKTGLHMYRSTDHGQTWTQKNVTADACAGTNSTYCYSYNWMDVAPDGSIGLAYYHTSDNASTSPNWFIYAGTAPSWNAITGATGATPVSGFTMVSLDPTHPVANNGFTPWGDFFTIAFGSDNKLSVVWTKNDVVAGDTTGNTLGLNSNIYYAVESGSLTPPPPPGVPEAPVLPLLLVIGAGAAALVGRLRRNLRVTA